MCKVVGVLIFLFVSFAGLAGQTDFSSYTDWQFVGLTPNSIWEFSPRSIKRLDHGLISMVMRQRADDPVNLSRFRVQYLADWHISDLANKYEHFSYGINEVQGNCASLASATIARYDYDDKGQVINSHYWSDLIWRNSPSNSAIGEVIAKACAPASADECGKITGTEYGSPSELKGIHSYYVDTDTDLELRANIIKEITKKHPELIVTNLDAADVVLVFSAHMDTYLAGYNSSTNGNVDSNGNVDATTTTSPRYRSIISGTGLIMRFTKTCHARYLMSFGDKKSMIFERRPSTNFARAFLKAYEEANGLGNKK